MASIVEVELPLHPKNNMNSCVARIYKTMFKNLYLARDTLPSAFEKESMFSG